MLIFHLYLLHPCNFLLVTLLIIENKFDNTFQPDTDYFQLNQRIEKTIENVNGADLVLFMVEANGPLTADDCSG